MVPWLGFSANSAIHLVALRIDSPVQRDEQKIAVNEPERMVVLPNTSKKACGPEAKWIGHSASLGRSRRQAMYDADTSVAGVLLPDLGVFTRQLPYLFFDYLSIVARHLCLHHDLRVGKSLVDHVGDRRHPINCESHRVDHSPTS